MALPKYYNTGTVSVANGATAVTGAGTAWNNIVRADDVFRVEGFSVRIASVTDNTHLTLAEAWPGTSLSGDSYEIAITYDGPEFQLRTRELLEGLTGAVTDIVAGDGITVDATDPNNPIITATSAFDDLTTAAAFNPDTAPAFTRTAGYADAGDGGGALYKLVVAEPSHEGKYQDAAGNWYEIAEATLNPMAFGATSTLVGAGSPVDSSAAWQATIDAALILKASVGFPAKPFYLATGLVVTTPSDSAIGFSIDGESRSRSILWTTSNIAVITLDCNGEDMRHQILRNFRIMYTGTAAARTSSSAAIRFVDGTGAETGSFTDCRIIDIDIQGTYYGVRFGPILRGAFGGINQIESYFMITVTGCDMNTTYPLSPTSRAPKYCIAWDRGSGNHINISNSMLVCDTSSGSACIKAGDGVTAESSFGDITFDNNHYLSADYAFYVLGGSHASAYNSNIAIGVGQFDAIGVLPIYMRYCHRMQILANSSLVGAGAMDLTNCDDYIITDKMSVQWNTPTRDHDLKGTNFSITGSTALNLSGNLVIADTSGPKYNNAVAGRRNVDTDYLQHQGGTSGGARHRLYGASHATLPSTYLINGDNIVGQTIAGTEAFAFNTGVARMPGAYAATTASAANVFVDSAGRLFRSTSALKYKNVLGAIPRDMVDRLLGLSGFIYAAKDDPDGRRYIGMAADDFHEARLDELVTFGDDGEVEGLQYERVTALLLEEVKSLRCRLDAIEAAKAPL